MIYLQYIWRPRCSLRARRDVVSIPQVCRAAVVLARSDGDGPANNCLTVNKAAAPVSALSSLMLLMVMACCGESWSRVETPDTIDRCRVVLRSVPCILHVQYASVTILYSIVFLCILERCAGCIIRGEAKRPGVVVAVRGGVDAVDGWSTRTGIAAAAAAAVVAVAAAAAAVRSI